MRRVGPGIPRGQPPAEHGPSNQKRRRRSVLRLAGVVASLLGAASGWAAYALHWSLPALHIGASGTAAVAIGFLVVSGCAALMVAFVFARLLWRAGEQMIETSRSNDEAARAFHLIAVALIAVLRFGRPQTFLEEPEIESLLGKSKRMWVKRPSRPRLSR
jgi:hypothetical protein